MKTSVNFSQFCDAFYNMGRADQFSYEAKRALFDFIEEMDDQCGTETELDVIALCCEYAESSIEDLINDYNIDVTEAEGDEDEIHSLVSEYLNDHTMVVSSLDSGSFVYTQF